MRLVYIFAVLFIFIGMSGIAMASGTENVAIDGTLKEEIQDLPKDRCVERLKQVYPRVSEDRLEAKCDALRVMIRSVDVKEEFPRIAEAVQTKFENLNEEEQNKLRIMTREQLEAFSEMTPEKIRERLQNVQVIKIYDEEAGFHKRVVAGKAQLKTNYEQKTQEQTQLETQLKEQVQEFTRLKQAENACADQETEECEQIKTQAKEQAKTYLEKVAEVQLKALERLRLRIQQNEDLTEEEAEEILEDIVEEEAKIQEMLQNMEQTQTKDQIKSEAGELFRQWNRIKNRMALHEYKEYHAKVMGIFYQAKVYDRKLDRLLDYFAEHDMPTDDVQDVIDEYSALIESARTKFADANDKLKEAWELNQESSPDVEQIKILTDEARELLRSAHEDIKAAAEILREIFLLVQDHRNILDEEEEDDYYDVEDEEEEEEEEDESECVEEGESYPVTATVYECCEGLTAISCSEPTNADVCPGSECVGSMICANCGDGTCGDGENKCNCPEDCEVVA